MKKTTLVLVLLLGIGMTALAETNLLVNPGAEANFDGWTRTDSGDGWAINLAGEVGSGVTGIPRSGINFWASSHSNYSILTQTIDLLSAGYSASELDATPDIHAGVFIRSNTYAAGKATIMVELCTEDGSILTTHDICNALTIPMNSDWEEKFLVISEYGTGVRKINFFLKGRDDTGWDGYFGTQFDDAYVYLTESTPTSISNESTHEINISPNPVVDFITINGENGLVHIYDISGHLVLTDNINSNKQLNVSSLPKGLYVVKTETQHLKFIKL